MTLWKKSALSDWSTSVAMCRMSIGWRRSASSPAARSRSMKPRKFSVKGAVFRVFGSSAFMSVLVELGAHIAHDLRPAHRFPANKVGELLRRHRQRPAAFLFQALLEIRRVEHPAHLVV